MSSPPAATWGAEPTRGGLFEQRVWSLALAEPRTIWWVVLASLLEAALGLAGPWLSSTAMDTALGQQARSMLAALALLVVLSAAHRSLAGSVHDRALLMLRQRLEPLCLTRTLRLLVEVPLSSREPEDFGRTNETMALVARATIAVLGLLVGALSQVVLGLAALVVLGVRFPPLALFAALAAVLMGTVAAQLGKREAALGTLAVAASSREQQWLHVLLLAVPILRVSGATERALIQLRELLGEHVRASIAEERMRVERRVAFQAFPQLLWLGITTWVVYRVLDGEASLGDMLLAGMLTTYIMSCSVVVIALAVQLLSLRPQLERVNRLLRDLEARPARVNVAASKMPLSVQDGICVEGVWFRYGEGERWVLTGRNERFGGGEISWLRAESGSGKSTLLRLIAGLVAPERGSVRVLGYDPARASHLVAYLPQDATLLEASIASNLELLSGRPLPEVLSVAEHTGLAQMVAQLPLGYGTPVAVRGGNLSAGQRQLVLLTAVFASARPVVLLDEGTSHIDIEARSRIDWSRLSRGRTVVLVTHEPDALPTLASARAKSGLP